MFVKSPDFFMKISTTDEFVFEAIENGWVLLKLGRYKILRRQIVLIYKKILLVPSLKK